MIDFAIPAEPMNLARAAGLLTFQAPSTIPAAVPAGDLVGLLDVGSRSQEPHESSMAKSPVSEEVLKVADRRVQILGGVGISDETPVRAIFSDIRAFHLYDGPTEAHKYAIARQVLKESIDP